ncbi:MAG: methyltransferase [Pirellulaceae bacterium]
MDASEAIRQRAIPGGWSQRAVSVGEFRFELILPADPDEFVYAAESSDNAEAGEDIYWAQLWPAARIMARHVVRQDWPPAFRAVELGCGIGLVGLAAAARGLHVTFTDYVDAAVELATENARRNGYARVSGRRCDWRHPWDDSFDVVLASDVLYYQAFHEDLLATIDRLLGPRGVCWIGDGGREPSLRFIDLARARFQVSVRNELGVILPCARFGEFFLLVLSRNAEVAG